MILFGDVHSLHLLVHPGLLPGVALKHADIVLETVDDVDLRLKGRENSCIVGVLGFICITQC